MAAAVAATLTLSSTAAASLRVDRFDAERSWRIVERQLSYGQRPAGSPQLRRLAHRLRRLLPHGRFEALGGQPGLRNVVGTLPGRRPGIVIGAHYDTLVEPPGFIGANNGAAGSAVGHRGRARPEPPAASPGRARAALRALRRGGAGGGPAGGEQGLLPGRPARLARLRGSPPAADGGDDPARLRREPRTAAAARGQLHAGAVGAAAPRGLAGSAPPATSPTRPAPRSSTITRHSCGRACRRSTSSTGAIRATSSPTGSRCSPAGASTRLERPS